MLYSELFKTAKNAFVFLGVIGEKGGSDKDRYFFTAFKVFEKSFRVVNKFTGIVLAGIETRSARDASVAVNFDNILVILISDGCHSSHTAAYAYAFIASDAVIVCLYKPRICHHIFSFFVYCLLLR